MVLTRIERIERFEEELLNLAPAPVAAREVIDGAEVRIPINSA